MSLTKSQTDQDLHDIVRKQYADVAINGGSCCGPTGCGQENPQDHGFDMIADAYKNVEGYVPDADLGLGCGLPVEHAGLKPGNVVLDLGSGAGLDAFVARREVGENGHIIGVDMTPEMISKARRNALAQGYDNVEFRLGEIEALPIEMASTDVVISNCVLNLVPDKSRAFAEIYRVLKPGGHFCVSDIVASSALPDWTLKIAELYAGCVAGAIPKADYLELITRTGFKNVIVKAERRIDIPEDVMAGFASPEQIADTKTRDLHVLSVTVTARKPL